MMRMAARRRSRWTRWVALAPLLVAACTSTTEPDCCVEPIEDGLATLSIETAPNQLITVPVTATIAGDTVRLVFDQVVDISHLVVTFSTGAPRSTVTVD